MLIAMLLFEGFTTLDVIGPYEVLRRLPGARVEFAAPVAGRILSDSEPVSLEATCAIGDLAAPDVLVVPGGPGEAAVRADAQMLTRLADLHRHTTWTASVCTGSLILAAAGLLDGQPATTHWLALEELGGLGAQPRNERVVFAGRVVTAAGVSAGIDMALALAARIAGDEVAQAIQLGIEYDPQPPFAAGSPATAPPAVVELLRRLSRFPGGLH
jgi:putative intracellular protease/amidase